MMHPNYSVGSKLLFNNYAAIYDFDFPRELKTSPKTSIPVAYSGIMRGYKFWIPRAKVLRRGVA